jgi:methyl-accepting chemotaxis protein
MTKLDAVHSAESEYLAKINKIFTYILLAHLPVALVFAHIFETGILFTILSSLAICTFPLFLRFFTPQYKLTSIVFGISLMFYSGLLIHLSKGMIETHFHIFVALASLIIFANPLVILAATGTIAIHHLAFYFLLPESVFNYQASLGIVLIHAAYVVVETIPCMWIAKKFGDYIIRQGVVVQQIDQMNKAMTKMISELRKSNELVANDTSLQSESVIKTAEAINKISLMVSSTTANSSESRSISSKTKNAADEGLQAMHELSEAFLNIKRSNQQVFEQMDSFNNQLSEIVLNIKQIEVKTQVINDIVFQTKLLSFNASVESARAGEHGKGFAVVAEEVGNLATMSGNASKEINQLINLSVKRVVDISESTNSRLNEISKLSKLCIEEGESKTSLTTKRFGQLANYLNDLDSKVVEISNATQEQSQGIDKITSAISELESVSGRAIKAQGVSNQVSENLSHLSNDLGELVDELLLDEKKAV